MPIGAVRGGPQPQLQGPWQDIESKLKTLEQELGRVLDMSMRASAANIGHEDRMSIVRAIDDYTLLRAEIMANAHGRRMQTWTPAQAQPEPDDQSASSVVADPADSDGANSDLLGSALWAALALQAGLQRQGLAEQLLSTN